jgi:hypothetical protein
MNSLATFWANHGTKVLGSLITLNSGIALGSTALPPPLDTHAATIKAWAVFIDVILGPFVVVRGYSNTQAVATAVTQQHADAVATAAATGTIPVLAPAGQLAATPKVPPSFTKSTP